MSTLDSATQIKIASLIGGVVYAAAIFVASALLYIEPDGFDARVMILPLLAVLLLGSLGIGYGIAAKSANKGLVVAGTVSLAVLLMIVGFFIVTGVAWLIALSYV